MLICVMPAMNSKRLDGTKRTSQEGKRQRVVQEWQRGSHGSPIEGLSTFVLGALEDEREDDQVRRLP